MILQIRRCFLKRRDFLKGAAISAGALASGMLTGKGGANPSDAIGNRKQGADFYKIDAFSHFAPVPYLEYLRSLGGPPSQLQAYGRAWPEFSDVHGLQPRLKMMEDEGIDVGIIFPQPDLEGGLGPVFMADGKALSAAVFINDYMSKMCTNFPKFRFAALLPLTNKNDMTAEFNRAINLPGMVGVGINTGPFTKPADDPIRMALYGLAASKNVPVWIHLSRGATYPDYMTDPPQPTPLFPPNTRISKAYNWLNFGFLADGSADMMRIVVADVFKKNPGIRIIVHQRGHLIPLYKDRIKMHFRIFQGLNPPPVGMPQDFDIDYTMEQLKQFYVDAICMGEDTDLLTRSVDFFGADHVMYATDTPFSPNGGRYTAQMTRNSVLKLQVSDADLKNIFAGNIQRLMNAITR
jgi:aminocarboxymuconate-semialdehyde decarboxylase